MKKKFSKVKWFDKELLTKQGEILLYQKNKNIGFVDNTWFHGERSLFFKPHYDNYISSPLGEIVYYYLSKEIGLNSLEVRPAYFITYNNEEIKNFNGSVSESFIGTNQKLILSCDFNKIGNSITETITSLKKYVQEMENLESLPVECNYEEIEKDLKKVALLDYLTLNKDRHKGNLGFLVTSTDTAITVTLAPVFDNAMIFYLNNNQQISYLSNCAAMKNFLSISDVLKTYLPLFTIKPVIDFEESNREFSKQVAGEIYINKEYKSCFHCLKEISFDKIYSEIQKDIPNFKLEYRQFVMMQAIFNNQVENIQNAVYQYNRKMRNEIQK